MTQLLTLLPLLAPLVLLAYALFAVLQPRRRSLVSKQTTALLGWFGILISIISAALVINFGTIQSELIGWKELGFAIRMDALSLIMLTMIAILGFIILKFSNNYLDGDHRKSVFMARLSTTIASVELLVLSGNLAQLFIFWVITSVCLHYLLVFYRNRPQAIAAARKKFIVARVGDLSLLISTILLYSFFGCGA